MIDQNRLEHVLRARLAGFDELASCERLSGGASRETYRLKARINGAETVLALRWSPGDGQSAMKQGPGLDAEARLFSAAKAAGVPGPDVRLTIEPEDDLGSGFVMDWIEGETLGARIARSETFAGARKRLARQCGEILARLHAIDVEAARLNDELEALTPEHAVRKTHAAYLEFNSPQPMIDFTAKWLLERLPSPRKLTLVHGDFRNGNLIVEPDKGVAAVLDWELAHIGDPMRDLGWLCTRSWRFGAPDKPVGGFGDYEALFAGYEAVAGCELDRGAVRFWEIFGSFWWSVGCLTMAQTYREGRDTSLERPAIGRRSSECQVDCVNMIIPDGARTLARAPRTLSTAGLPRTDELLASVRDFLRKELAGKLKGRDGFLARVGANSLDIVLRELELGADAEAYECEALRGLLGADGPVDELREKLCCAIRLGEIDLKHPELHAYLRNSVLAQVMIDQPNYPGAQERLGRR